MRYLKTVQVPIADLHAYPGNPRVHAMDVLVESAKANSQYRAVVARQLGDGSLQLLAGHGTTAAFAATGAATVRVEVIEADDAEARRIVLVDNRSNDLAGYDDQALAELLVELAGTEQALAGTGFDQAFLDELLAGLAEEDAGPEPLTDPDDVPEPPADPITQPGDVWLLGPHRVIAGDARDPDVVATLLGGARVNVAFTSPPYASQRTYDPTSGFVPIRPDDYVDWFAPVAANVRAVLAEDGSWFVNIKEHAEDGQRHLYVKDLTIAHVRAWGWLFVDELIWVDTRNGFPGSFPNRFKDAWEPVFHFAGAGAIKFNPLANGTWSDNVVKYDPASHPHMDDDGYHVGKPRGREERR